MSGPRILIDAEDVLELIGEFECWAGMFTQDGAEEQYDYYKHHFDDVKRRAEHALMKHLLKHAKETV